MRTHATNFNRLFSVLALVALAVAACSPASKAVATQRPISSPAPTTAAASPTARATAQPTSKPATAAPTAAATKAPATAQPTLAAPTATSPAEPTEERPAIAVPLGEVQHDGALEITALKVEQAEEAGSVQPQAGNHFEFVTVRVTNTDTTRAIRFYPEDFVLNDTVHDTTYLIDLAHDLRSLPNVLPAVPSTEIQPGQALTGVIVFEVPNLPNASANWELKYQTNTAHLLWSLSG